MSEDEERAAHFRTVGMATAHAMELLEALEALVKELEHIDEMPPLDWDYSPDVRDSMAKARALIERVRGRG